MHDGATELPDTTALGNAIADETAEPRFGGTSSVAGAADLISGAAWR